MFDNWADEKEYQCYEDFKENWYPIYRRQILNAKFFNNRRALVEIKENIYKSWYLKDYRLIIVKELGIYHLITREDLEYGK